MTNNLIHHDLINIGELLKAQKELDDLVFKNAGTTAEETKGARIVALFVEAGEMLNEIGHIWKYWKKNHKRDFVKIKEELADVLHFILSIGNDVKAKEYHTYFITYDTPIEQIKEFIDFIPSCDSTPHFWDCLFAIYRGLLHMLGITWDEMVQEYWRKHQINIERQKAGY